MVLLHALLVSLFALSASAADAQGFGSFNTDELSPPGGVQRIVDPTGAAPTRKVDSFSIPSGYCNPKPYVASGPDSDCYYNSTRAQKSQASHHQPAEAWYGWWMYLPADFPYGKKQVLGHYEFAYWHNGQCPHVTFANFAGQSGDLILQTNRRVGNYDCAPEASLPIARMADLAGRWTRFETFVKWGDASSGHLTVYLNGKAVLDRDMATLTAGMEKENYFKYGIYLCCTKDINKVKPMQALFAGVKSAKSREGLAP